MKTLLTISAAAALAAVAFSFTAPDPGTISYEEGSTLVSTGNGTVIVTPVSADIFRITRIPDGIKEMDVPRSQSAILAPEARGVTSFMTSDEVEFVSASTILRIDRSTGRAVFLDAAGDTLLWEAGGVDNSAGLKSVRLRGARGANLYGAGERGHSLRLNGDTLVMYNRQNYGYTAGDPRISQMGITMPYFLSDDGYAVLFDDYNEAVLNLGDTIVYESETPKPLSYYFINGSGEMAKAVSEYTRLTGRQDLPPFWTLGYITSKYGYHNQQEALGAVDSLKTRGYPLDGIVFDLYWYGVETDMGRLEWDKIQFPDHRAMLDSLNAMGVNTILISQPYINKIGAIDNYHQLASEGMLTRDSAGKPHDVTTWVGEAGMFDISNPDTREWLWNRLSGLTAEGLAGWWGDLGEPEVHPRTIVHSNGETAPQYHNVYGNEWSRLIYEGLRSDFPDKRPVLLMRGGTAGLQRYSVFPWTTDVSRSWEGMRPQVNLMLSSGLSGLGYMSSDIGGFVVDPEHPTNPELYVRWLQMGVFTPVLRTHAQMMPEPYHYPEYENITRDYIRMRYQWLPYNYTLAYENASQGLPLARPLNFLSENYDQKYANIDDEYLWGDNVLVAPVFSPGVKSRKVLFPAGEWYSWWNPAKIYKGGTTAIVPAPVDKMPLFVRAGSFIPQYTQPIENVTEYDPRFLTIIYFPSTEASEYTLFEDDRESPVSLQTEDYSLTTFLADIEDDKRIINILSRGSYPGMPESRIITLEIPATGCPRQVAVSKTDSAGEKTTIPMDEASSLKAIRQYGWYYDKAKSTLYVKLQYSGEDIRMEY